MKISFAALLAAVGLAALPAAAAASGYAYKDADWHQATIPSSDGVELHADILRPKGATLDAQHRTPVILSIGPYFNHSGQVGPAGPVEGTSYDPVGPSDGPSERFQDFVDGTGLLEKGYTYVMVDLRGFGGSTGCLDWAGPGETSDVVNAVQWLASQDWSTGKVGMYGKSYDAMTGLIGVDQHPEGLGAVVAQEPVYDDYRYLYGDGIRRENSLATPALYDLIDATPGPVADADPNYVVNGANDTQRPGCLAGNFADQAANDDHYSAYWRPRNLIPGAKGSQVPLFLTQGLTENNTVADGTAQYLENHPGPERAWLGPWEHVRGNERVSPSPHSPLKMGREGWFDEVMRFYDQYLKGIAPTVADPPIAVQTNDGKWRAEQQWPPADARGFTTSLNPGTYEDAGTSNGTGSGETSGVWTISPPMTHEVHLAGSGHVVLDLSAAAPRANVVVDVYDLDEKGTGPLITRQGHLIRENGPLTMDLWSADWKVAKGHRIAVRVTETNQDWWLLTVPTRQTVTVHGGSVTLPFLDPARTDVPTDGKPGVQLAGYLAKTVTVPPETIQSSQSDDFAVPALTSSRARR